MNKLLLFLFAGIWYSTCYVSAQEISFPEIRTENTALFVLDITGIDKVEGEIRVAMFSSKDSYTKDPVYAVVLPVDDLSIQWTLPELPYGEYAIAIYHDKNTNGKLDTNLLGIPKEDYGFSNNARGRFGPASWDNAHFVIDSTTYTHEVEIR